MKCRYCQGLCVKKGCAGKRQRYRCKSCNRYQQSNYVYALDFDRQLMNKLNNEGVSVSGMGRILGISKTSVCRKLMENARLPLPAIQEENQVYEIDELFTYVGKKEREEYCCVVTAMNRATRQIVAYAVGKRTNEVISPVIDTVLALRPKQIITDGCSNYSSLIPKSIHRVCKGFMHRIERFHLTLRTRLKRLQRETICLSRNERNLDASVRTFLARG